jgi:type I restriction enzyme S subunit
MQQLLTGKTRLPGFVRIDGYKPTELGPIPKDWDAHPLRADIRLLSGHHVLAQYYNTKGHGVPYLTGPADFPDGKMQHTKFTSAPTTLCQPKDILVTVKGSGAGTLVEADAVYCISRQLMAIRTAVWDSRFIFYSLLQNASKLKAASTGLIPGLTRADILDQQLPIPSNTREQNAIAAVISNMDAEIDALERRGAKTRAIKQGMMQQLLTGRIRLVTPQTVEARA